MLVIPIKPLMQTLQHFDKISVQLLQLKGENISKEVYEMILYGVADKLAASMKSDQAVLLSKLYHDFLNTIITESKNYPLLSSTKQTNSSSHYWVLCRFHSIFGESLVMI